MFSKAKSKISNGMAAVIGSIVAAAYLLPTEEDQRKRAQQQAQDNQKTHIDLYASEIANVAAYRKEKLRLYQREIYARESQNNHLERLGSAVRKAAEALESIDRVASGVHKIADALKAIGVSMQPAKEA